MKNLYSVIFLFLLLFSRIILAGDQKGSGADAVVCGDKVWLLDFYEQQIYLNDEPLNSTQNELEILGRVLKKAEHVWTDRIDMYRKQIVYFHQESRMVDHTELGDVTDTGNIDIRIPKECKLEQLILQKHIVFGTDKRFLINKNLWNKLSATHKAGAILHEIFYRELKLETSKPLRKLNAFVFKHLNESMPIIDFYQLMQDANFVWAYLYNIPIYLNSLDYKSIPLRARRVYPGKKIFTAGVGITSLEHMLESYNNGVPKFLFFRSYFWRMTNKYKIEACLEEEKCQISYFETGHIRSINNAFLIDLLTNKRSEKMIVYFDKETGEVDESNF